MLEYETPLSKLHMRYSYNTHARIINVYHPIHVTNLVQCALLYNKQYAIDYRVSIFLNPFLYLFYSLFHNTNI